MELRLRFFYEILMVLIDGVWLCFLDNASLERELSDARARR